ncbi:uncharacterized protein LOC128781980 isoform X1 [Vidua chalybeata]|uniref:uncharacterized protein LOC128781980 isoform X1 n=1 Tax=Vidua chalybeata TaxID=81927 RepID=UPI0023A88C2A|nr:uncharacterized protein LOC128781980 isoform X1 [Vidua chalybeata]
MKSAKQQSRASLSTQLQPCKPCLRSAPRRSLSYPQTVTAGRDHRRGLPWQRHLDRCLPVSSRMPRGHGRNRLQLTEPLHLRDSDWHFALVNNEERGTWHRIRSKYVVLGDTRHTPQEIRILPDPITSDPGRLAPWLHCVHPPIFLPKDQIIAQVIPVAEPPWDQDQAALTRRTLPIIWWSKVLGNEKPKIWCGVHQGGEQKHLKGLLDTGADVMIIPSREWLLH